MVLIDLINNSLGIQKMDTFVEKKKRKSKMTVSERKTETSNTFSVF